MNGYTSVVIYVCGTMSKNKTAKSFFSLGLISYTTNLTLLLGMAGYSPAQTLPLDQLNSNPNPTPSLCQVSPTPAQPVDESAAPSSETRADQIDMIASLLEQLAQELKGQKAPQTPLTTSPPQPEESCTQLLPNPDP
jgi:hypothetical protein